MRTRPLRACPHTHAHGRYHTTHHVPCAYPCLYPCPMYHACLLSHVLCLYPTTHVHDHAHVPTPPTLPLTPRHTLTYIPPPHSPYTPPTIATDMHARWGIWTRVGDTLFPMRPVHVAHDLQSLPRKFAMCGTKKKPGLSTPAAVFALDYRRRRDWCTAHAS